MRDLAQLLSGTICCGLEYHQVTHPALKLKETHTKPITERTCPFDLAHHSLTSQPPFIYVFPAQNCCFDLMGLMDGTLRHSNHVAGITGMKTHPPNRLVP